MPTVHRHIIRKDLARLNGTPSPAGTYGFVCVRLLVNAAGGETIQGEEFRSTGWPTRALCKERLAQHEREHEDGTPVEDATELLRRHGYQQDGKGGTKKITQAELLAAVGASDTADTNDEE